jgi:hypothetical protein
MISNSTQVDSIHASPIPNSEVDRYVTIDQNLYIHDRRTISAMWNGNYQNYATNTGNGGDGYEVKGVSITCTPYSDGTVTANLLACVVWFLLLCFVPKRESVRVSSARRECSDTGSCCVGCK